MARERPLKRPAQAFTVVEVLVAIGICLSVLLVAFPAATNFYLWQAHQELRLAASTLTTAILQEQHHAICTGGSSADYLMMQSDGSGYQIIRGTVPSGNIAVTNAARQKIHLDTTDLSIISFNANGVPRYYGQLRLRHDDLPETKMFLQVQPVTGRIVLN